MFEVGDIIKYYDPTYDKTTTYYLVISREMVIKTDGVLPSVLPKDTIFVRLDNGSGWGYFHPDELVEKVDV